MCGLRNVCSAAYNQEICRSLQRRPSVPNPQILEDTRATEADLRINSLEWFLSQFFNQGHKKLHQAVL